MGVAGRKGIVGIVGIGNSMCKGTELLSVSQESVSTVTGRHLHISIWQVFLYFSLGKPRKTLGMLCRYWAVDKTAAVAHASLIGGL